MTQFTTNYMPSETPIQDHYQRIANTIAPLGAIDKYSTLLVNDKKGWYVSCDSSILNDIDPNYEIVRRSRNFTTDYKLTLEQVDRTLYTLTSYKRQQAFERWEPATFNQVKESYVYKNQKPAPKVKDIAAIAAWGDVDLADDLKPQRSNLDSDTYTVIEKTYDAYLDAFAELYGGRDAVYMLDSVGGAYLFGSPEATLPIFRLFKDDADARARVFGAFIERSNDYLRRAEQHINDTIDRAQDVIHPDWVNNHNRQYKMPLSIHSSYDYIVTPVDVTSVQYREPVPLDAVNDDLLEAVQKWCEDFTARSYEDRIDSLVATLWPEVYELSRSWSQALKKWVETQREQEQVEQRRREQARERRKQRLAERGDSLKNSDLTPFISDVYDGLDRLSIEEVADQTIVHQWTDSASDKRDNSGNDKRAFVPIWRPSSNGTACYVDEKGSWNDTKEGYYGTSVDAALIAARKAQPGDDPANGRAWIEGVSALRDLGFEIPVWIPEAGSQRQDGTEYETMPFWAVRKATVALDILPRDAFVEKEADNGSTYPGFPGPETYNQALEAIEDAGLVHQRDKADVAETTEEAESPENTSPTSNRLSRAALKEQNRLLSEKLDDYGDKVESLTAEVNQLKIALAEKENLNKRLKEQLDAADDDPSDT